MELEKKVQILEQEIEVLKNEIQATLLDIKEQLLTNTYPTLRADVIPPAAPMNANAVQVPQPAPDMSAPENEDPGMPKVRKVSLDDLQGAPARRPEPAPQPQQPEGQDMDWETMQRLENWTIHKLTEIGPQRTRELIDLYTENGRFSPDMREVLLQMVAIETDYVGGAGDTIPAPAPRQQMARPQQPESRLKKTEVEPRRRPAKRRPAEKRRGKRPAEMSRNHRDKQPRHSDPPRQEAPIRQYEEPQVEEIPAEEPPASKSGLVLRLIAGVQNAGAGVKWKTKNG